VSELRPLMQRAIAGASAEELADLEADLAAARLWIMQRLIGDGGGPGEEEGSDRGVDAPTLLTQEEAAAIARTPVKWLNRKTRGMRFRKDLSRQNVRYEERGFRNWLAAQGRFGA